MNLQRLAPWWAVSIFLLALSGCSGNDKPSPGEVEAVAFEELRSELRTVIEDPARSEQALAIVDKLQLSFDALRDHLLERRARIGKINADYDASREDVTALLEEVQAEVATNQHRISTLHRQLTKVITADEWSQLAKAKGEAMSAAIDSIQAI